ncbi:MAG: DUF58 domain-containing protein, partial [Rhodospirillaceae bacterium]|nr:DUF58 domain-containing protein [Rhodospirillaceae bacterium]
MAISDTSRQRPINQRWTRSGAVVSDLIVIILIVVAIVGAATGKMFVTALCGLILVLAAVSRLWSRLALVDVDYQCLPSSERLLVGEMFELTLVIENRKPLPLPWLNISETLPEGLALVDRAPTVRPSMQPSMQGRPVGKDISDSTGFGPYQRVKFHHYLQALQRGIYGLGPTRITSGDIFGFYQARLDTPKRRPSIIVYPRWVPLPEFDLRSNRPIGDSWSPSRLTDDPTRPAGLREYRPGDPAARIDWKATARRDEVFIRTYDASVVQRVVILLECDTSIQRWRIHPQVLEAAVTGATSVAVRCLELGYSVGLVSNGNMASTLAPPLVAPGAGPDQLSALMTTLAGANPFTTGAIEKLVVAYGAEALPHGATVVYISGAVRPATAAFVADLGQRGHRVTA